MGISTGLAARSLARLAVASGIACGLPTAAIVRAQLPKGQEVPPPVEVKTTVKAESVPALKVRKVQVKTPPPAVILEPAVGLRLAFPAPPAGPAGADAPGADLETMIRQMTQRLRPPFRTELRLLSSACEPSPTQRREIAVEGARAVKDAARDLATVQQALQQGGWRGGAIPDARKLIREGLRAAARGRLSPEQVARYEQELDQKARDQRKTIALNLVANLDRLLFLSGPQREKIAEALLTNWDDRTFPTLENLANYESYFPVLPDRHIAPLLNDAQRKTWNGVQKVNFGRSFNFFNGGVAVDPADVDEDENAAMAEVEKKP